MYKQDWKDMKKYLRGMKDYFYLLTGVFNITIVLFVSNSSRGQR